MDGRRSFKVVVSEVGDDQPVAQLRCPECGCKHCKIIDTTMTNDGLRCNPDLAGGFFVQKQDPDMPKTNGVNIVVTCSEGHTFWYWFHTAGYNTVITHGLVSETPESNIGGPHERRI